MKDHPTTRERIDELLRFRPTLGSAGPDTVLETDPNSMYPSYTPEVKEFFDLLSRWWQSPYDIKKHGTMLSDDEAVKSATLAEIKSMLTFCTRGERFSDGHWLAMIREGRVGAVLDRLAVLRETVD